MKLTQFQSLPKWLKSNAFFRASLEDDSSGPGFNKVHVEVHPLDANLIGSQKPNGKHTLFLDLDGETYVVDSSTLGHKHVYINTDLSTEALKEIIDVLAKHGIVQEGIKQQLDTSGFLTLRPPGVIKGNAHDDANLELAKHLESSKKPVAVKTEKLIAVKSETSKEVLDKYQKLKEKLTGGKNNTAMESRTVVVNNEVCTEIMTYFFKKLNIPYSDIIHNVTAIQETILEYKGRRLCIMRPEAWMDANISIFQQNDYVDVSEDWPTWIQVKEALNYCFGG